jgi:dTMP kinase
VFGSRSFFRLWLAQVVSALGDWLGFIAVTAIAVRIGGSSGGAAVGLVLSARLIPGFFFGSLAGVVVDRLDRKKVMVACDIGRGAVLALLPFVTQVWELFIISLLLEVMTLMWSPAKEASVPNLVPQSFLSNANSLSLVAAYATFPLASVVYYVLTKVAENLSHYSALQALHASRPDTVAIWFDVGTFFLSAIMISTLALPARARAPREGDGGIDLAATWRELKEGWQFIRQSPLVRAVILGLATGLIGGGMVVPLGPIFSRDVLKAGSSGFGLLLTGLGMGVAFGIVVVSVVQRRLPHERAFVMAVAAAGGFLLAAASMSVLGLAAVFVGGLGVCAGAVYVLGFTVLQTNVADEMRGRIFATLYTLVRFCLLLAFTVAPLLAQLLDGIAKDWFNRRLSIGAFHVGLPGVRLTLWLGGLIILGAAALAMRALRGTDTGMEVPAGGADGHTGPPADVLLRSPSPPVQPPSSTEQPGSPAVPAQSPMVEAPSSVVSAPSPPLQAPPPNA